MRIGLAYDVQPADALTDHWAEWDQPATVDAIERALQTLGHEVVRLGSAHEFLQRATQRQPRLDLVFSIAEGVASRTREAWVPTICEMLRLPYVGSAPQSLILALDKWVTKQLWRAEGLPVPWGMSVAHIEELNGMPERRFPLIVKPRYEGAGMGIDVDAIVQDAAALRARVAWALRTYEEPVLVEQFIRGGEVTVCLLGDPLEPLPVVQRHVDPVTTLSCHIAQKSLSGTEPQWATPAEVTPSLERTCAQLAVRAAATLGCRDLARVDLRVAFDGQPCLLEANPLPSLDADSSFALLADTLGWGYAGLLQRIIEPAVHRTSDRGHQTSVRARTVV